MAYTYWAHEMDMQGLGTATSLWRHSDAASWEFRSLIDGEWHPHRVDRGPSAPDPSKVRPLTEQQARDMVRNAPRDMYVYTQRLIGESQRPGAVSRRIPSPESFQDQVFSVEGSGGKWKPTTSLAEFTNTYSDDRPSLRLISHEDARRHVGKRGADALKEFDRPFNPGTAASQQRAAMARAGKFQSSLGALPEAGERPSPPASPHLAAHPKVVVK
ncbi:hypothetical protein [Streptomyces sp. NRRL B-3229]|uniref:hypothetical protein n=1 Tax=Streptomyces sp. NRRL B-3229 TaxID=1463836 RepID=UPI0004C08BDC|nr:hypothetical protein [Streptomyces sp. NRRL B-3229]